jgi:hypothetical protein
MPNIVSLLDVTMLFDSIPSYAATLEASNARGRAAIAGSQTRYCESEKGGDPTR